MKLTEKWDMRFLELAKHIAQWSKDPSTKVGAVIVRPDKTIVSVGYNGFPRGVKDSQDRYADREVKYSMVVHAEVNAILNARENLRGYTLYEWPPTYGAPTCDRCATCVIQSGIIEVIAYAAKGADTSALRWQEACERALVMYKEAGVNVRLLG